MILISVIIPTFGHPILLESAILSVLRQTFKEFELIIVDDNDPQTTARKETESLASRYIKKDSRVKYIKHNKNMNGAVARNTGFAIAKGKYISLLDSDDEYMPERLEKCYTALNSASEIYAGVYTGCEFRRSGKVYNTYSNVKSGNFLAETLACNFMFCTGSNIFIRQSVVKELEGFDPSFFRHQDYEFLVRVFEKYSLKAIPEVLVVKNNENFNLPNLEKQIAIKKQYLEKYKCIIDRLPQKDINFIMHGNYINIAENAMAQSSYKIANQYYGMASQYSRLTNHEWFKRIIYPLYNLVKGK